MNENTIPADMLSAIEAAHERCATKLRTFTRRLDETPPPPKIYHYTDSAGLVGILESGRIRLTDIYGLNDPSEVLHAVKHAGEVLAVKAEHAHPAAKVFAKIFVGTMDKHLQDVAHFFVACFSHDHDELSQWRAYADNGHGFALGFRADALERSFAARKTVGLNASFPVTYADTVLRGICESFVDELMTLIALPAGRGLSNPVIHEYMRMLSVRLGILVFDVAMYFKHKAYKAEREYRLLHVRSITDPMTDVSIRARRHGLVRFIEFDWKMTDPTMLEDIVIGPAANDERAAKFIQEIIRIAGLDASKINVVPSKIPYRS